MFQMFQMFQVLPEERPEDSSSRWRRSAAQNTDLDVIVSLATDGIQVSLMTSQAERRYSRVISLISFIYHHLIVGQPKPDVSLRRTRTAVFLGHAIMADRK